MSKQRMRGHFRYLRFKTFPMTPITPQCEVFWSSKSSSEFSGVPEDSNPNFFQVLGFTPTLGQSRVATILVLVLHQPLKALNCFRGWTFLQYLVKVVFIINFQVYVLQFGCPTIVLHNTSHRFITISEWICPWWDVLE